MACGQRTLKSHVLKEYHNISGFLPERWTECRCGWTSEHHYSAREVKHQFKEHQKKMRR